MPEGNIDKWLLFSIFISFWLQYAGINYKIWGKYRFEIYHALGRIVEVFPYSAIGLFFAKMERKKLLNSKMAWAILIIIFGIDFVVEDKIGVNFGYAGVSLVIKSILLFFLFVSIPEQITPLFINKIVEGIGKYTFGIYCVHFGVGYFFDILFWLLGWKVRTFFECILIYFVSLFCCFLISKIPFKFVKRLVF